MHLHEDCRKFCFNQNNAATVVLIDLVEKRSACGPLFLCLNMWSPKLRIDCRNVMCFVEEKWGSPKIASCETDSNAPERQPRKTALHKTFASRWAQKQKSRSGHSTRHGETLFRESDYRSQGVWFKSSTGHDLENCISLEIRLRFYAVNFFCV